MDAELPSRIVNPAYRVQVLERVLSILDLVGQSDEELSGAELSRRLGLHKSTGHRLLAVLETHRYLRKDAASGKYGLGLRLIQLGTRAASRIDLRVIAQPHLEKLAAETGETAHVGILQGDTVLSIAHAESGRALRAPLTVGQRSPAHTSSQGKAMLAFLPPEALREFVYRRPLTSFTKNTITRFTALKRELARIRARGYAVDNEEIEEGLKCIGAPIRDHTGKVIAAVSIAGPASRLNHGRMPALVRCVTGAASELSHSLGYRAGEKEQ